MFDGSRVTADARPVTRRRFLRAAAATGGGLLLGAASSKPAGSATKHGGQPAPTEAPRHLSPDEALRRLMDGNERYVSALTTHPDQTPEHRVSVAQAQHPFAVILGCADSRVPPEIIFDQGIGDLFVNRVAGNIVDDAIAGSIEYAVEEFKSPLVVVLGHERCGAVKATLEVVSAGGEVPGHLGSLVEAIAPAVEHAQGGPGDWLDNAVRANVALVTRQLRAAEPILADRVRAGEVTIVGARYDLDSGVVDIIA